MLNTPKARFIFIALIFLMIFLKLNFDANKKIARQKQLKASAISSENEPSVPPNINSQNSISIPTTDSINTQLPPSRLKLDPPQPEDSGPIYQDIDAYEPKIVDNEDLGPDKPEPVEGGPTSNSGALNYDPDVPILEKK